VLAPVPPRRALSAASGEEEEAEAEEEAEEEEGRGAPLAAGVVTTAVALGWRRDSGGTK
jgi:hypothetical protein